MLSSVTAHLVGLQFGSEGARAACLMQHPTQCQLFEMFIKGLERRMGRDVRPNMGLDYRILHLILENVEQDLLSNEIDRHEKRNKGFVMERQGLLQHLQDSKTEDLEKRH
eukprot:15344456-Ditylum_brightwellii.AAC.1